MFLPTPASLVLLAAIGMTYVASSSIPTEDVLPLLTVLRDMETYASGLEALNGPASNFDGSLTAYTHIVQQMQEVDSAIFTGFHDLSNQTFTLNAAAIIADQAFDLEMAFDILAGDYLVPMVCNMFESNSNNWLIVW